MSEETESELPERIWIEVNERDPNYHQWFAAPYVYGVEYARVRAPRTEPAAAKEDLRRLRQMIEDTIAVAQTDVDRDGWITAYHFLTGAIHRLLAEARQGDGHIMREALADFQHAMETETIPAIQRDIEERAVLADQARRRGPLFAPCGELSVNSPVKVIERAREILAFVFPQLKNAPIGVLANYAMIEIERLRGPDSDAYRRGIERAAEIAHGLRKEWQAEAERSMNGGGGANKHRRDAALTIMKAIRRAALNEETVDEKEK